MTRLIPDSIADERFKALEDVLAQRLDDIDLSVLLIMRIDSTPDAAVPSLGAQFKAVDDLWNQSTTADRKGLLKRVLARRRVRGTPWAVKDALSAIGYDVVHLQRRPTITCDGTLMADGTFCADLEEHPFLCWVVLVAPYLDVAAQARVLTALDAWKQKSVHFGGLFYADAESSLTSPEWYSTPDTVPTDLPLYWIRDTVTGKLLARDGAVAARRLGVSA